MKAYFEQFGDVEKVRLARNKKVRSALPNLRPSSLRAARTDSISPTPSPHRPESRSTTGSS